ncbi:hypothetical protein [Halomonas sp. I5-271120]|uniref:hypothetical protein n=1 Tax=Halomonas sp. I5-271120 TaxID=3061632 RepID=UPI0027152808|nr:hypothetical protein [Halomonas sp. I5-271120]
MTIVSEKAVAEGLSLGAILGDSRNQPLLRTAAALIGDGAGQEIEASAEYARGQVELISDLLGIPAERRADVLEHLKGMAGAEPMTVQQATHTDPAGASYLLRLTPQQLDDAKALVDRGLEDVDRYLSEGDLVADGYEPDEIENLRDLEARRGSDVQVALAQADKGD